VAPPLAEIIFTSGATADPKGVTLTDRNILANIEAIEEELRRYRRFLGPLSPIRFLNLLPLSHMFGQSMATFVPPMLGGTVVFSRGYNPQEIVRQIRNRRISVLVCVPKVLEVLKEHVERNSTRLNKPGSEGPNDRVYSTGMHAVRRIWAHRDVHRMFGWKFWAIVIGGAPLEPALEQFWRDLGFLVIQGYGLTETAPIVTLNHPLRKPAAGTVGTPIAGVEVKIADDGEVLVRGENVTGGYYGDSTGTREAFAGGWFHTGDIGTLDSEGRLTIRGRKKEMIVTADGLNVFPDDVERALNAQSGVRESAVVGISPAPSSGHGGGERVHAVLVLAPGAAPDAIIRAANASLEDHQRVRTWSVWHDDALPRTEGTRKLRRREIQRVTADRHATAESHAPGQTVDEIVSAAAGGRAVTRDTTFDELGLASLDRMQLLAKIEEVFQTSIDETEFGAAATVGALADLVTRAEPRRAAPEPRTDLAEPAARAERPEPAERREKPTPPIVFPKWNRTWPARALRRVSMPTWVLGASRIWMDLTVEGVEHLDGLDHPVIFAPNHQSHIDTPAILQALPAKWRYRVAPAMAKEWFKAHFFPDRFPLGVRIKNSTSYYLASLLYNAFPIPQYEGGTRQTIRYIGQLFEEQHSLLIYPEGKRTDWGEIATFRPGVGMMASKLGVPVIPVRIEGLDKVLSLRASWPTRGPARITFGKPMWLEGNNYVELAAKVRDAVVALQPYSEPEPGSVAQ
jgi:long-chain acyl-CoA synthetase